MTKLQDLMAVDLLMAEIAAGNVRVRTHPDNDNLAIYNYTEQAQYTKHWNAQTLQCRGLIVDRATCNVLARPFDKFFNVGEYDPVHNWREELGHPWAQVRTVDKLDGSLGILYMAPDGLPAIATRGSFTSDQAQHATALLRERYTHFAPDSGMTYLFEIVYPENRIVLDYGDQDDLILLGVRNIETGRTWGPQYRGTTTLRNGGWIGPRAEVLPPTTFAEALAFGDRTNREGLVVTFEASGLMVKIKQEDYVRLHKLVTGLNERAVWEHLSTHDGDISALFESIPDEFHRWVEGVANGLFDRFEVLHGRAHAAYHSLIDEFESYDEAFGDRKEFALLARERHADLTPLLFQLLDGRDISASIWKTLKPKGQTESLMNRTEDVS